MVQVASMFLHRTLEMKRSFEEARGMIFGKIWPKEKKSSVLWVGRQVFVIPQCQK